MRTYNLKSVLKAALRVVCILPLAAVVAFGQQTINLTAGPTSVTLPDGTTVPMWGYSCGAVVTGSTATCAALNPASTLTTPASWSPVVITVPTGQYLTIMLTNNLSFTAGTGTNTVPTSLMIVGQLGGGLGAAPTTTTSPSHANQGVTWATTNTPGGTNPTFAPPPQGPRVQSFGTEVAFGTPAALTFGSPTNPLKPGTYLLESGTHPSIQGTMGLYGMLVVTTAPVGATAGTAYPAVGTTPALTYGAEVPLLLSEIDPVQNKAVQTAVNTAGFSETKVWSGQPGQCGNPSSAVGIVNTCYPPAVNYTPLYYLFNGVAFNKTSAGTSLFAATPATGVTGSVLVRLVNAGSRMHVPAIIGSQTGVAVAPAVPPTGFSIIAEDGNPLPGLPRVQTEIFMAAGKTNDVMINVPAAPAAGTTATALPVYDRELSLSGNAIGRDTGMLAFIGINGAGVPTTVPSLGAAVARADTYNSLVAGHTFIVSDPSKGVIANDTNVYGVQLLAAPTGGTVTLNANGTFTYVPTGTATSDSFTYCANGSVTAGICSSGLTASVALGAATIGTAPTAANITYNANVAGYLAIKAPGVLSAVTDPNGYPVKVVTSTSTAGVIMSPDGAFTTTLAANTTATQFMFTYQAQNSQGTLSNTATVTINFPAPSNLQVSVVDGKTRVPLGGVAGQEDYRWIIEEDRSFYVNPNCTTNSGTTAAPAGCPSQTTTGGVPPTYGVNFHTSNMPFVAQGCTGPNSCETGQMIIDTGTPCVGGLPVGCSPTAGTHVPAVCDVGDGACRIDATAINGKTIVKPSQVSLDPTKRYYISVLPGDAADPFYIPGAVGNGMGGAPIPFACPPGSATTCAATATFAPVTVLSEPSPYPPGKLSVFVYEDDFPLNGEHDGGGGGVGGLDTTIAANEPGLGQFQIHLWDAMAGNGDFTGQMGFDMFNQPLSNSLAGTIDPATNVDACPISVNPVNPADPTSTGITGFIVTCPEFEKDGKTYSPLAGQAVVANLMPGRWGVIATPGADRIARGEEWLQTNTLDGQKAHDVFTRISEPGFFQEYGPAAFHVSIGFANPVIINSRLAGICKGTDPNLPPPTAGFSCGNTITGKITGERLSRTPDERLYSSTSHDAFTWTQCFASVGDPDGEDFAFTKCAADGTFKLTGIPNGDWRITTFDQWNDQLVDGLSTPVRVGSTTGPFCPGAGSSATICNMGDIAATQWQTNLDIRTFIDDNKDGLSQSTEAGIPFNNVAVRLRDGSLANLLLTDFSGVTNFNETFPLFSWYVVETDTTRYKNTGTHVVYDAGGPADGTLSTCGGSLPGTGYPPCGTSTIGKFLANTAEQVSVPTNLRVPGSIYCANADCAGYSMLAQTASAPPTSCSTSTSTGVVTCSPPYLSTGRIDPPWVGVEGWQGFPGQISFIEFGKEPYVAGENGGIKGHVEYASTRPFDDPYLLVQTQWTPLVPNVTINLYQEGTAPDGSQSLKLVDTTKTSSWDDFAQGFRADGVTPNMSCPGQSTADLFYWTLFNQPDYLDVYNNQHSGTPLHTIPNNSQFKCYDGMHAWNQVQPAPYDGAYKFPSVTATDANGKPTLAGTNCKICVPDPVAAPDLYAGIPMLPAGKYVVEVVLPPGFELVKEEDKNILIGDNFIAPVTQEFGGLGNIFILPDQASVASAYNANNAQNPTQSFGASPLNGIVPAFVPEPVWPCVGQTRIVPDYISLYPNSKQVSPFAGATRTLCDRKEVTLGDQMGAIAKFFIYTSTHIASKFTGGITDDFTSEFDPFSPQFGEKFAPPDLPVSFKDWTGAEISRVYADHWGAYNGMTYSTWEVNPPNPTGYAPTMMVVCMNDPGPIMDTRAGSPTLNQMITDPLFNPSYSQFCYELPFMPGTTQYLDTPVVPTSAFAGAGYNNVDCAYPTLTPAISEVDGDGIGPWVSAAGKTLTIHALGDQTVNNYAYSGPSATTAPYNQKTVLRHYGFGTTAGTVAIDGKAAAVTGWNDTQITVTVPSGVSMCSVQQQTQYGGPAGTSGSPFARCGELVITTANTATAGQASNARQSIDTVTVTIGGKGPKHVLASGSIQSAIDAAMPGDLIIVDPATQATSTAPAIAATHNEILIMWKPVRLQGVGAASSILNANAHPAGKLDVWRRQINCLFGLSLSGYPISGTNPYDSSNPTNNPAGPGFYCSPAMKFAVDRLPLEAVIGWDATQNGNLAEQLQEPSLMGALEGAGITVLSKGVTFPTGTDPFGTGPTAAGGFPTGTLLLQDVTGVSSSHCTDSSNPFPSNFMCNPSSIDGLSITDSSQGGGGIFVHGWGHNIQIANNRIYNNAGTLSGGINVGQGEFPPSYSVGGLNAAPGSCQLGTYAGEQLPYCHELNVNLHNNYVSANLSTGDELFSVTPAGAGGVSICTGADYYKFQYNWICGNISTGDGGGVGHIGYSWNGDIEHNTIVFNQSTNPTVPTNGGGLLIMGAPDADPTCGITTDLDCLPFPANAPSDGVGPGLVINANLIMGNAAESGSGGGLRLQGLNGTDVITFPSNPNRWYSVSVTNNIITNNVAGWDGAGISLEDALAVNIINNTIVSNDTTASSGVLFNTLGAPLASSQGPCPYGTGTQTPPVACVTASTPQPAGLVAVGNSPQLTTGIAALPTLTGGAKVICPSGHPNCAQVSYPVLDNDVFWQNRTFHIAVGALSTQYQQNIVSLYNGNTGTLAASQTTTGQCPTSASYWDIGVRGDTAPGGTHASGFTLAPTYSVLTDATDYPGLNNLGSNPAVVSQYCNGSRTIPEAKLGGAGWQVPPGISDATVPNPIFSLTPTATVDEGNNWVNIQWGPLTLSPAVVAGTTPSPLTSSTPLGNYSLTATSPAINYIPAGSDAGELAPSTDFFGNPRPDPANLTHIDVGAVEFNGTGGGGGGTPTLTSIAPNTGARGTSVNVTLTGTNLTGATSVNAPGSPNITVTNFVAVSATSVTATLNIATATTLGGHNITVTAPGGTTNAVTFTVTANPLAPTLTSIAPISGVRGAAVPVTFTGTNLTGATWSAANTTLYPNITVTGLTVVNSTTVTATLHIATVTVLGIKNFSLTTPNGTSNNVAFRVTGGTAAFAGPTPALTTATPNTTTKNGTITVTNSATGANAGPLTLTANPIIAKVGAAGGTFSITGGTCVSAAVINPAPTAPTSCTINVQYVPGPSTATATAHVTIADTGAATATQTGANFTAN